MRNARRSDRIDDEVFVDKELIPVFRESDTVFYHTINPDSDLESVCDEQKICLFLSVPLDIFRKRCIL